MESQNQNAGNALEIILDQRLDKETRIALLRAAYDRSEDHSLLEDVEQAKELPRLPPTYPALRKFVDYQETEWTSADSVQMIVEWKKKWELPCGFGEDLLGILKRQLVDQKIDLKYNMLARFFKEIQKMGMRDWDDFSFNDDFILDDDNNYKAKDAFEKVVRGKKEPPGFNSETVRLHSIKDAIEHVITQAKLFNQKNGPASDALLNEEIDLQWNIIGRRQGTPSAKKAFQYGIFATFHRVQDEKKTDTVCEMVEDVRETMKFENSSALQAVDMALEEIVERSEDFHVKVSRLFLATHPDTDDTSIIKDAFVSAVRGFFAHIWAGEEALAGMLKGLMGIIGKMNLDAWKG